MSGRSVRRAAGALWRTPRRRGAGTRWRAPAPRGVRCGHTSHSTARPPRGPIVRRGGRCNSGALLALLPDSGDAPRAPQAPVRRDTDLVAPECDPVVLRRDDRLVRFGPRPGDPPVPVDVQYGRTPSLGRFLVTGLVEDPRVDPTDLAGLAEEDAVVGRRSELVVVCREAGIDQCRLVGLGVVERHLPGAVARDRKVLGERVGRPGPAERGRVLGRANPGCPPHAAAVVHRRAARLGHSVEQSDLVAPVSRRRREARQARQVHVTRGDLHHAGGVGDRIQPDQRVGGPVGSVHSPVGVHRGVAFVGDGVGVRERRGCAPVPLGDHEVALDARGPGWRFRRLARGDAVGPVGEHRALRAECVELSAHAAAARSHLHPMVPGIEGRGKLAEHRGDLPRRLRAELMTHHAALHASDHVLLRQLARRHLHEGQPGSRRIHGGGGARVGRRHGVEIQRPTRSCRHPRRIHQPVAPREHLVVGLRQIRQQVAPLVVGDHGADEAGAQVVGFRDHPHAGFGALRAGDDPADVVAVDGDRAALLRVHVGQRSPEHARDRQRRHQSLHDRLHVTSPPSRVAEGCPPPDRYGFRRFP